MEFFSLMQDLLCKAYMDKINILEKKNMIFFFLGGGGLHITQFPPLLYTEAKFLVPDWELWSTVLLYRPASQRSLAGRCDNPLLESTIYPPVRD
jgi:hypothetical protein